MLWDACGLERTAAGLTKALAEIAALREAFWDDVTCPAAAHELNQELERAGRVADFLELGELMCRDALAREESCGCHFREEHPTPDGEALRDDARFAHVAAWLPGAAGRPRAARRAARLRDAAAERAVLPMKIELRIWRQDDPRAAGGFVRYSSTTVAPT